MYKRILFFVFLIGGCINVKAKDIIIKSGFVQKYSNADTAGCGFCRKW